MVGPDETIIHDGNYLRFLEGSYSVDGTPVRTGGRPRSYASHPSGCYGERAGIDMPLIPAGEVLPRLRQKVSEKSLLSDIRNTGNHGQPMPSRDQNGRGYCWQHSGVSGLLLVRALQNQPYKDLSAYGPACVQKQFRDEGGWGAAGVDFLVSRGCPTSKTWPQQGTNRSYDNPETWAEAANYKLVEGWWDLAVDQYDRRLTWDQFATCLLSNIPVVADYNWWSHSVLAVDLVEGAAAFAVCRDEVSHKRMTMRAFEQVWDMAHPVTGGMGGRIWNSWGDSWSQNGTGVLAPQKFMPDGAVALRTALAA